MVVSEYIQFLYYNSIKKVHIHGAESRAGLIFKIKALMRCIGSAMNCLTKASTGLRIFRQLEY